MKIELDKTNAITNIGRMARLFIISLLMVVSLGANEYSIVKGSFTWNEARQDAEAKGGNLAAISSPAISKKIDNLLTVSAHYYWIGATDKGTEGAWRWTNEDTWNFDNWLNGDPNNSGGIEHYGLIFSGATGTAKNKNKWLDARVDYGTQGYILEIKTKTPLPEIIESPVNTLYSLTQPVPPGFSMISIPFSYKDNTVPTIFGATSNIVIYDYDYDYGWLLNSYDEDFEEWDIPSHTVSAGTAVWVLNNTPKVKYIKFKGYKPSLWRETSETFIP